MYTRRITGLTPNLYRISKPIARHNSNMSLIFPRMSSFGPVRHEFGPFLNLFNDTFNELQKMSDNASRTFSPKFDVKEANDIYTLEGELPGINQKDISIEFSDDQTLTIKGRTEHVREEGQNPQDVERQPALTEGSRSETSKEVTTTNAGSSEIAKAERPNHTYWVSERSVGEFARSFHFPSRVDHDHIKASLKDGILSVVIPKLKKVDTSRRIAIE